MNIVSKIVGHEPISDFASRICLCWRRSAEAFIEAGKILSEAKDALPHGEFLHMVERELPFDKRVAQMLMKIAADPRLVDAKIVALLPPHYSSIYEVSKLDDEQLEARIADGTICPSMDRKDIASVVKHERRAEREIALATKVKSFPDEKFGVIYADPPWKLQAWSEETGLDRAAEQHYETMTVEEICDLRDGNGRHVSQIVAPDAVLFLWITVPFLDRMNEVLKHWGPIVNGVQKPWQYVSNICWDKINISTGRWARNQHELLLIARVGDVPAPADVPPSIYREAAKEHSRKPEYFAGLIERHFYNTPKIELFRRGPARQGWAAWGKETVEESA